MVRTIPPSSQQNHTDQMPQQQSFREGSSAVLPRKLHKTRLTVAGVVLLGFLSIPAGCTYLIWSEIQHGKSEETYQAWKKAYPDRPVSYEEWKTLKRHELLPGQSKSSDATYVPVVTPIYTR